MDAAAVEQAYGRILGIIHKTPAIHSKTLDEMAGGTLYLKMESFQRTGAFKFRGAIHALACNLDAARSNGVVTGSSGNHGGALALAAKILGVPCTVVVPADAVQVKVAAIEASGATIIRCGHSSAERLAKASELADGAGMMMVPPYDHPDVIAGQGTVALEVLEQVPEIDVFIAPCGGGGLIAGCSAFLSQRAPDVEVWGVEPEGADDTARSLEAGERIEIDLPSTIADGIRNVTPGELTFPIVKQAVRGVVLVSDGEIRQALRLMMLRAKVVAEPTGAVSVAAAIFGKVQLDGRTAVAVVSGGNVDPSELTQILGSSD